MVDRLALRLVVYFQWDFVKVDIQGFDVTLSD